MRMLKRQGVAESWNVITIDIELRTLVLSAEELSLASGDFAKVEHERQFLARMNSKPGYTPLTQVNISESLIKQ